MAVDPVSPAVATGALRAGGQVTSALVSAARGTVKLGSREERREVYARCQATAHEVGLLSQYTRFQHVRSPWYMRGRQIDRLEDRMREVMGPFLHAYCEMELVASNKPWEAAGELYDALSQLMNSLGPKEEEQYEAALQRVGEARRKFAEACREDLGYQPKRWQFWRRKRLSR
ncbi:hypothetical protein ACFU51_04935 [Streptomyces sp. NPDC057430]|uniref:hypothetical protein n=1 Tax=Streptomyces sp. NPDC057430 TaxID=3346131 RepID=UPI0036B5B0D0